MNALEDLLVKILKTSHISSSSQEQVIKLFQQQSSDKENGKELKPKAQIQRVSYIPTEEDKQKIKKIYGKIIETPVIQNQLKGFQFHIKVNSNPNFDGYEDCQGIQNKTVQPNINIGVLNPTFYPKGFKDMDSATAYVLGHELGHTIVANEIKNIQYLETLLSKGKQTQDLQRLKRSIEFICDTVGTISCLEAGYNPNAFNPIADLGRTSNNLAHPISETVHALSQILTEDANNRDITRTLLSKHQHLM